MVSIPAPTRPRVLIGASSMTIFAAFVLVFFASALPLHSQSATKTVIQIQKAGTGSLQSLPTGSAVDQGIQEFDDAVADEDDAAGSVHEFLNRSIANAPGLGANASSGKKAKSNPQVNLSVDGLNFFNQRFANGGNQFSVEPPDQGLCAGNGYVLESVNDVLRVYDGTGNAVVGVTDLNTFYGYIAAINRGALPAVVRGPTVTDPVCYFDVPTQRWFHVVLTLDHVGTTANLNGNNHLDIAVSDTPSPLGSWTIYRLPVQNNGTDGTPDHGCALGSCLGDYPHIGADANGIYLTTNEFSVFGPGFYGSQIYAISKQGLVSGAASIPVVLFNTADSAYLFEDTPGFTVWPAQSPSSGSFASGNGGTEYLMSSQAVFSDTGVDSRIRVWSITNTQSLNTASPSPNLSSTVVNTIAYAVPNNSNQKNGDHPQGELLGRGVGIIGRNDSRMQQVSYANGKLWGSLDTGLTISGRNVAGVAYFVINPSGQGAGKVVRQGYVGLANNHLTRPAVAVTASGRGVIGFTVVGDDYYPSAGYASLDAIAGAGDIHVVATGVGPQDGFTEYSGRARWGDYGAAAVDGNSIWLGSEYINQSCTVAQYLADSTCGGTRGLSGNWGTRISKLTP